MNTQTFFELNKPETSFKLGPREKTIKYILTFLNRNNHT